MPEDENYNPRQRRLLKERLYRWALNSSTGSRVQWGRVSDEIHKTTGVRIPKESLRQNIKPSNRLRNEAPREFDDESRYTVLHDFLLAMNYLKNYQLDATQYGSPALALAFEDFFNPNFDPDTERSSRDLRVMAAMQGRFTGIVHYDDACETVILDIDVAGLKRLVEAHAFFVFNDDEDEEEHDIESYSGWVIARSAGFAYFFLSEKPEDENTAYKSLLLLQTSPGFAEAEQFDAMAFFDYSGIIAGRLPYDESNLRDANENKNIEYATRNYGAPGVNKNILVLTREELGE